MIDNLLYKHEFFMFCYANPGMERLLGTLDALSGADMSDMARRGLDVYKGLAETLNAALAEEVDWSPAWHGPMPLWQVLVANVNRLGLVEQQLRNDTHVRGVVQTLKERAAASMAQLLEGKDDLQISGGTPLET